MKFLYNSNDKGLDEGKWPYPHAAYISTWKVDSSGISLFSPMGDNAACIPGPRTNPKVWKRDNKEICVIRSLALVAFAT